MNHFLRKFPALMLSMLALPGFGQEVSIEEPKPIPVVGPLVEPFHIQRRIVSAPKLDNSPRLQALIRGDNLYLTARDVIALVLENNVDIAIQRYGPFLAREVLRRTKGGGFLRSVGTPIMPGPVSVSLAGVSVSNIGLAEGGGVGSGGGIVVQIGPTPPNLDPYIFGYAAFTHTTSPLSNTALSHTPSLINDSRTYQLGYAQSFSTGTNYQVTWTAYDSKLNSPSVVYNPAITGNLDLYVTENLLQGFSRAVNDRDIRVAKNNMKVTDLQLKLQVITTVSAVLNLYWDLVSFNEDMRIKEQQLATAQKLDDDNKKQVELGTLPAIEVTRAAAQVSASKEDLLISQTNVAQQETVLKNALSRNGVESSWLDAVHIVPLDSIVVPPKEDLKPVPDLIREALVKRPEIEQTRINIESSQTMMKGSRNALLPTLQAFAELTNNGLAGPANPIYDGSSGPIDPYYVGGYGTFLAQVFRRNFPNYSAGFSVNISFRNRAAQADYVTDQLSLRQSQLQYQRSVSQIRVDVKNAVIGLQQARARYEASVATRELGQQTLEAEQNRFKFGQSTISLVIQAQRDLATDQSAEVQAMANYTHAKIAFDEAVGQTMEANNISMADAESGHVPWESKPPENAK